MGKKKIPDQPKKAATLANVAEASREHLCDFLGVAADHRHQRIDSGKKQPLFFP